MKLHKSNALAPLKKALRQNCSQQDRTDAGLGDHPISFYAGRTLPMLAAWRGRETALRWLLTEDQRVLSHRGYAAANPNATDELGFTALMMAAWAGRESCVRWLLTKPVSGLLPGEMHGV